MYILHVEPANTLFDSIADFFRCFSYSRKHDFRRFRACCQCPVQLASADYVDTGACLDESLQYRQIGVGLGAVMDVSIEFPKCALNALQIIDCALQTVDIDRGASLASDRGDWNIIAVEGILAVMDG